MGIHYHEDEAVLDSLDDELAEGFEDEGDFSDTAVLDDDDEDFGDDDDTGDDAYSEVGSVDDFVGENSVVFDVDNLVAEFEAEAGMGGNPSSRLRRRLEALAERKRRHNDLMDFDDYDIDL